jgi:NitT/TauT family transport system substrate-binding protein
VQNWIDKNGGDSTSVQYLEIPLSAQLAALKAGRIDAAAMVEPWISHAKGDVTVLGKPYDSVADQFMISGWVTTKNWIHNNRPALEAFVATMRKTAEWANTNPKQTGPILSKYFKIPLSTIDAVPRTMMGITLDPKLIQPVIDMEYKYKLIPKTFAAAELFPEHTA